MVPIGSASLLPPICRAYHWNLVVLACRTVLSDKKYNNESREFSVRNDLSPMQSSAVQKEEHQNVGGGIRKIETG